MKKAVLKLDLHDEKAKKKAMKTVSSIPGVESISMDMKDKKLTVTGDVDTVHIVSKLRKLCNTEILTVGPAKEPEKKKDEPKKEDPKKKEDQKKEDQAHVAEWFYPYQPYYPYKAHHPDYPYAISQPYYPYGISHRSVEENPNGCLIS